MKKFECPVSIRGNQADTSGLQFPRLLSTSPAAPAGAAALGVDSGGNVVVRSPNLRAGLWADVSNTPNTVTDVAALAITVPANNLVAGGMINFDASGLVSNSALGSTFNFWVKIGTTKVLVLSLSTPLLGQSGLPFVARFQLAVRAIGASGHFTISGSLMSTAAAAVTTLGQSAATAIDTTAAQTLTLGFNWSGASTANILTVRQALINAI